MAILDHLGTTLPSLGAISSQLGVISFFPFLATSLAILWPSWSILDHLGVILGTFWAIWGHSGAFLLVLSHYATIWAHLVLFWPICRPPWYLVGTSGGHPEPSWGQLSSRLRWDFCSPFSSILVQCEVFFVIAG